MTHKELVRDTIKHGLEVFRDHVAEYKRIDDDFDVLDFRKPGTVAYSFRMVFDRGHGKAAYISGDLGEAVIYPTCDCTLEGFAQCFTKRNEIVGLGVNEDYFMEKIRVCNGKYEYDMDDFADDLKDLFNMHFAMDEWEEFADNFLYAYSSDVSCYPETMIVMSEEAQDWLGEHVGLSSFDTASCGRRINPRIVLWLVAIRLAWEQLEAKNADNQER